MKTFLLLAVCLVQVFVHHAMADSHADKILATATECQKSSGAVEKDMDELLNREFPSTKQGKCLRKCMMEHFKIITDGKLSVDGCVEWVKGMNADAEKIEKAKKISEGCVSVSDPDGCEYVGKLITCFVDGAKANGLDPKKMF